jgi:hypothetical protein
VTGMYSQRLVDNFLNILFEMIARHTVNRSNWDRNVARQLQRKKDVVAMYMVVVMVRVWGIVSAVVHRCSVYIAVFRCAHCISIHADHKAKEEWFAKGSASLVVKLLMRGMRAMSIW